MQLRPFQENSSDYLVKHKRSILADEMGLGKTRSVLAALQKTGVLIGGARVLILCGKNATYVWRNEIEEVWAEILKYVHIVKGKPIQRRDLWLSASVDEPGIFISTYAAAMIDFKKPPFPSWDVIIIDEYHRRCLNRKSKTCKWLKQQKTIYFWATTGTSSKRGCQDMWPMLNILARMRFSSYWRFVNSFCVVEDGYWGKEILGPKNVKQLQETIRPYMVRHLKKDVMPELPPKTRQIIPIEMSIEQRRIIKQLEMEMIAQTSGDHLIVNQNVLVNILRMRQLLVCPKILDETLGIGTSIEATYEMMQNLPDMHCMIFTPFVPAIHHVQQYLIQHGVHEGGIVQLFGGLDPEEVDRRVKHVKNVRGVAICSIQYAEAFSVETASYGFFLGFDWDPWTNFQAEDRLHRMTTKKPVNIYYNKYIDAITDDRLIEVLDGKVLSVTKFLKDFQRPLNT